MGGKQVYPVALAAFGKDFLVWVADMAHPGFPVTFSMARQCLWFTRYGNDLTTGFPDALRDTCPAIAA